MVLSLQDRVEKFLSTTSYLAFAHRAKPAVFSFIFEYKDRYVFNEKKNHEDVRDFFRGKKIKLVINTPDYEKTVISLVDIKTADSIELDGPKFITNNFAQFSIANLPEQTIFAVSFMCRGKTEGGENATGLHPYWLDKKNLEIHGYSIIDNRSEL